MTSDVPGVEPDQRGLMSTELALIMPIMFVFALLAIFVVHAERHSSRAQQAADAAARAASLERNDVDARTAAQSAAEAVCNGTVLIEDSGWKFEEPIESSFTPGYVSVSLSCSEDFTAFGSLVNDTSRVERGTAVAAIEYWRSK